MTATLYGWGAMFDLPSPSPYVLKSDIHLQMFNIPFERQIADLESVSKHKAPYVWDDGVLVEDSTFVRWHFEKKLGIDLDQELNAGQRAHAWTLERMLEHRLSSIMACERWLIDENFDRGPRLFFQRAPEAMRESIIKQAREDLATMMHRAGFTRFSRDERMELVRADLAAAAAILGENSYFFGEHPTAVDGACYGVIACCATPFFDSPLTGIVSQHANLSAYLVRMKERFFPVDRWPRMGS
jgi:hypothetical protein